MNFKNLNQGDYDDLVDKANSYSDILKVCREQEQRIIKKNRELQTSRPIIEQLKNLSMDYKSHKVNHHSIKPCIRCELADKLGNILKVDKIEQ